MNFLRASCSDTKGEYRANQRFSIFFQIDLEIIRMMRNENFNFSFAENISVQRAKIEFKAARAQKF